MTTFNLPDLGEGLQEAEIVAWHVGVGDHVVPDQPLVSVETDKAVMEIPAPRSGRIEHLFGAPGDMIEIGAPLVAFEDTAPTDTGTVVGEVPGAAAPAPEASAPAAAPDGAVRAAPAVRRLAARLGVDLAAVAGSGPAGAVTADDVRKAVGPAADQPLRGVRRAMARNMARARAEVTPTTVTDEADVDGWPAGTDVTIRLVRAVAAGCRAAPALNAWYDGEALSRRLHDRIDLGIATDTEDGLFVPVLRDVGKRDAADLRRGLDAMKADIESRRVPRQELHGQTITLSNFGMLGGRHAALVVVPPQVAILGAGAIRPRVLAVGGTPAVRRTLPLSLTFDHRAVTGSEGARFLAAAIADLEQDA